MQRLGGVLLMLAGASLGAYAMIPPPQNGEERLKEVTRISAAPDRTVAKATPSKSESDDAPAKVAQMAAAMPARPAGTWSAIVSSDNAAQSRLTSPTPGDGEARAQLTRDLQTELQRVGCYGGEVNGNWSQSTKKAMSTFMDRVNATLPFDEPDYILLTLVQGHKAAACGSDCPAGQTASEGGRCVPQAVMAQAQRKVQREEQRVTAEQKAADEAQLAEAKKAEAEERVAEAKRIETEKRAAAERRVAEDKRAAEQRAAQLASELKAKAKAEMAAAEGAAETTQQEETTERTVAAAAPEVLPWNNPQQLPAVRPEGMMSIGGPKVAKADVPEAAKSVTPDPGPAPMVPAEDVQEDSDRGQSAAPVITQPQPPRPAIVRLPPAQPGTKGGAAHVRGQPGTKSGIAQRKRVYVEREYTPPAPKAKKKTVVRRSSPPPVAFKALKPKPVKKFYYFAYGTPKKSKMYRPHYNMMQAYSGMY